MNFQLSGKEYSTRNEAAANQGIDAWLDYLESIQEEQWPALPATDRHDTASSNTNRQELSGKLQFVAKSVVIVRGLRHMAQQHEQAQPYPPYEGHTPARKKILD